MNARLSSLALSLTLVGVAACGTEADPTEVHGRIERTVPGIVDTTAAIAAKVSPADLAALPRGVEAIADVIDASAPPAGRGAREVVGIEAAAALVEKHKRIGNYVKYLFPASVARARAADPDPSEPTGAEVAKALNEELFTEANYAGDGVYRIPAEGFCDTDETGAIDAACAAEIAALKPTIRAEVDGDDALDLTLVIGSLEPAAVRLEWNHARLTVDLADVGAAIKASSTLLDLGSEAEATWKLSGVVAADLDVRTKSVATFAVDIDEPIHASFAGKGIALDSPQAFNLDIAKTAPAFRIQLDSNNLALRGGAALNATRLHVPADEETAALDLDLPGAAIVWNQVGSAPLSLDLSLGSRTTTVSVGGKQAIGIDLNPTYDRKLEVTVETEEDTGAAIFTLWPDLDLRLAIDHAVLGDPAPRFDVTQLRTRSEGVIASAVRVSELADGTAQAEIVGGTLTIATNPAEFGVTIAAGQCVGAEERTDDQGTFAVPAVITCQ